MIRLLFVCHGNICRSPMAESVFAKLIAERRWEGLAEVSSASAHIDALGEPPHPGTREKLAREGIPLVPHRARLMTASDGEKYDLLLGMDEWNVRDMRAIVGKKNAHKVRMLLDFTARPRPVADPWYTHDFEATYSDIAEGCEALADYLVSVGALPGRTQTSP